MTRERRPSPQTVAVVRALAAEPGTWRYGYELGMEVGLKAGSLYPILMRLTDRGLLEARWETEATPGRPPRHLYRLTGAGLAFAAAADEPARRPVTPRAPAAARPPARRPHPGLGGA